MTRFTLDPRLASDTLPVASLDLCEVRLQDDARWPWLVLVPRRAGLVELADLSAAARAALMEEVVRAGEAVRAIGETLGAPVGKLNVGALGNVVAQLHVHVIGRRTGDAAGTAPVWGFGPAAPYQPETRTLAVETALRSLRVA